MDIACEARWVGGARDAYLADPPVRVQHFLHGRAELVKRDTFVWERERGWPCQSRGGLALAQGRER